MTPKGILFDLDDTIIISGGLSVEIWKDVAAYFSKTTNLVNYDVLIEKLLEIKEWYWNCPKRHLEGRLDMHKARKTIISNSFTELDINGAKYVEDLALRFMKLQNERMHFFEGAKETLEKFKRSGLKLGLITNGAAKSQRDKVELFKLEKYFDVILIEGELGFGKPDIRIFELSLNLLKLHPSKTWMVGDNLEWDVEAPQKLGIYSIWNNYLKEDLPIERNIFPDKIINSISMLPNLL